MSNQISDVIQYLTRRPPPKKTRLGRFLSLTWLGGDTFFGDIIRSILFVFLIGALVGGGSVKLFEWVKTHHFNVTITEHK